MIRNPLTLTIGAVLLLIFGLLLFCFQVRKGEVAVVQAPSGVRQLRITSIAQAPGR